MNFSQRDKLILKTISESYPNFVSLDFLAQSLDVSRRTIQRDLKQLELALKEYDIKVIKKQNKGVTLKHDHLLSEIEDILMSDQIDLNAMQRIISIYQEFLFNDDFSTTNYLSEILNVSVHTINQDLDLLAEMLQIAHLSIRKKPGVGLELEGSEKEKRNGFTLLMSYYYQQENSFSIQENEFDSIRVLNQHQKLVQNTQKELFEAVKAFDFHYTDNALYDLWMYLVVTILRHQDHPIEESGIHLDEALEVSKKLFTRLNQNVSEDEIHYFAALFRSAKRVNEKINIESDQMSVLADDLIKFVSSSTGYYIEKSPQFVHGLITHLRPLISRLQEGVFVANPIKEQIKEDYPLLFLSLKYYFNQQAGLNVNDDEIGFLTLHFGVNIDSLSSVPKIKTLVICTSGIATSRMLTKKLLDFFPQMTIIEQSSLLDLKELDANEYDLIVSTIKLKNPHFDYIHVSPLLDKKDFDSIEAKVNYLLLNSKEMKPVSLKPKLNSIDHILKKIEECTMITKQLVNHFNVVESNVINFEQFIDQLELDQIIKDDLIQKQNQFGFGVPRSSIALVHTRSELLEEVYLSLTQNRSDIIMKAMDGHQQKIDTLLTLITPLDLSDEQLEVISFISISLLEPKNVKIYSNESEEVITQFIKNQLLISLENTINKLWR